jgi:ABC-type sugar transport system permease subunit
MSKQTLGHLSRRESRAGILFVIPTMILLLVFSIAPIAGTLGISFSNYSLGVPMKFAGIENYRSVLGDSDFRTALMTTLKLGFGLALPGTLLAFLIAISINAGRKTNIFTSIFFAPVIYPPVVSAFIWSAAYRGDGFINRILGTNIEWLTSYKWALFSIVLVMLWTNLGFYIVISLTGLRGISSTYYEAASIDGANRWEQLRWITIPLIKPVLLFIGIVATGDALQVFTQPYLLTAGGPGSSTRVLASLIYESSFRSFDFGASSTMAMVLLILALLISSIQFAFLRQKE